MVMNVFRVCPVARVPASDFYLLDSGELYVRRRRTNNRHSRGRERRLSDNAKRANLFGQPHLFRKNITEIRIRILCYLFAAAASVLALLNAFWKKSN